MIFALGFTAGSLFALLLVLVVLKVEDRLTRHGDNIIESVIRKTAKTEKGLIIEPENLDEVVTQLTKE